MLWSPPTTSGSYDLLVFAVGNDLREVAFLVFGAPTSVDGVLSTATHSMLRAYKEQGTFFFADRW